MTDDDTGWDLNIVGEIFDASLAADLDDPGPLAYDREPVGPPIDTDFWLAIHDGDPLIEWED